jgi:hypothetical protein
MQAAIDLALNVLAALAVAVMAQLGLGSDGASDKPPRTERVVARSPQAQAAPMTPQRATTCPEAHVTAPITV